VAATPVSDMAIAIVSIKDSLRRGRVFDFSKQPIEYLDANPNAKAFSVGINDSSG
jgi:hypothetical protein